LLFFSTIFAASANKFLSSALAQGIKLYKIPQNQNQNRVQIESKTKTKIEIEILKLNFNFIYYLERFSRIGG
jgi:hypothetical protein